jgi:ribosomal protein S18 acetylase RimI-like enzyme
VCVVHHRAARDLPEQTLTQAIDTRPASLHDEGFLFDVFVTTRHDDFTMLEETMRASLLWLQFTAQQRSYASHFPDAEQKIIQIEGERAGQFRLASPPGELRVIEISLLPQFRGRGAGRAVYQRIIERAAREGRRVTASVAKSNAGSLAFHLALGFAVERETETDYFVSRG